MTSVLAVLLVSSIAALPINQSIEAVLEPPNGFQGSMDDLELERLRRGLPITPGRRIDVALPSQVVDDDLAYWGWILGLDDVVVAKLRVCLRASRGADDRFRRESFESVFEHAKSVSNPVGEVSVESVTRTARALIAARKDLLRRMISTEEETWRNCLGEEEDLDLAALRASHLSDMRIQDLDRGVDTLESASVDVGRLLWEAKRTILTEESADVARTCLADAQPTLVELRRAHGERFMRRLEAGARFMLATTARPDVVVTVPTETVEAWTIARRRAYQQQAMVAQRIAEANAAIVESVCAAIPEVEAEKLRTLFFERAYRELAADPWNARQLVEEVMDEIADVDAARSLRDDVALYDAQSRALQREVHRHADRYWQAKAGSTRPDRGLWERTGSRIGALHGSQRAQTEVLLARTAALLPDARRGGWEAEVTEFQALAEASSERQRIALDPWLADRATTGAPSSGVPARSNR